MPDSVVQWYYLTLNTVQQLSTLFIVCLFAYPPLGRRLHIWMLFYSLSCVLRLAISEILLVSVKMAQPVSTQVSGHCRVSTSLTPQYTNCNIQAPTLHILPTCQKSQKLPVRHIGLCNTWSKSLNYRSCSLLFVINFVWCFVCFADGILTVFWNSEISVKLHVITVAFMINSDEFGWRWLSTVTPQWG